MLGQLGRGAAQGSLQWTVPSLEESELQLCAKPRIYFLREARKGRSGYGRDPCRLVDGGRSLQLLCRHCVAPADRTARTPGQLTCECRKTYRTCHSEPDCPRPTTGTANLFNF